MAPENHTGLFGALLKSHRIAAGKTIREFCRDLDIDAGNYSRVERGLLAPPADDEIGKYARALNIKPRTEEYANLVNAAAVDRANLPSDMLTDAQVVRELPLLFRTLRGDPVPDDKLDRLVDLIRKRASAE